MALLQSTTKIDNIVTPTHPDRNKIQLEYGDIDRQDEDQHVLTDASVPVAIFPREVIRKEALPRNGHQRRGKMYLL